MKVERKLHLLKKVRKFFAVQPITDIASILHKLSNSSPSKTESIPQIQLHSGSSRRNNRKPLKSESKYWRFLRLYIFKLRQHDVSKYASMTCTMPSRHLMESKMLITCLREKNSFAVNILVLWWPLKISKLYVANVWPLETYGTRYLIIKVQECISTPTSSVIINRLHLRTHCSHFTRS